MKIIDQETYYDLKQRQKSTISPNISNILLEMENNKIYEISTSHLYNKNFEYKN